MLMLISSSEFGGGDMEESDADRSGNRIDYGVTEKAKRRKIGLNGGFMGQAKCANLGFVTGHHRVGNSECLNEDRPCILDAPTGIHPDNNDVCPRQSDSNAGLVRG